MPVEGVVGMKQCEKVQKSVILCGICTMPLLPPFLTFHLQFKMISYPGQMIRSQGFPPCFHSRRSVYTAAITGIL